MSERQGPASDISALDIARVYARPQPDEVDELLGTPFARRAFPPVSPEQLRQRAEDTVRYLEARPAVPEEVPDPDAHYYATLGVPSESKKISELIDEWARAEVEGDTTRARDMREELSRRAERRSLTKRGTPYVRPNAVQAERPAYTFNALFDRKERTKRQLAPPAEQSPSPVQPPVPVLPEPAGAGPWERTKTAVGGYFYDPEHGLHRRIWWAAGALALSWLGTAATVYTAAKHGGMPVLPGIPGVVFPGGNGTPTPQTPTPPFEAPRIDQSLAGDNHTVWAAEQGLYPNQPDAQTSQELLADFATLKAHGWQADYWQDPHDPSLWGFSDNFVAPKDQYLYFPDGHIEHLNGQVYTSTDGTFGALEYADKYQQAQVVSEAQARLLTGVPYVEQVGPGSFGPITGYQLEPAVFAASAVSSAAHAPSANLAGYTQQPDVYRTTGVAVPTLEALAFLAYNQAWQEEIRRYMQQLEEDTEE